MSENGWTDSEISLWWLIKDFDAQTKEKAGGRTRVLLLDGHSSHHSPAFLKYAKDNNIVVLGYPPHCTHALQGLDVVCFASHKRIWNEEIRTFEEQNGRKVKKEDFTNVFSRAFARVFNPHLVKTAFRVTGIFPFDPTVISARQMKPAEATSVKGAFPMLQPSPVRAVMAAFRHQPPTAFDVDPETHAPVASGSGTVPSTPTRQRVRDPEIDPALYTPSKRMRLMTSALASTSSGSFLVSSSRITSQNSIPAPVLERPPQLPEPDWQNGSYSDATMAGWSQSQLLEYALGMRDNLKNAQLHIKARDGIIEATQATIVVQNLFVDKQSQALHAKETKQKTQRTKLSMEGRGRHLTSDEWMEKTVEAARLRDEEAAEKLKRADMREAAKAEKEKLKQQWERIKEDHERAVERWQKRCEEMTKAGVKKKDLPKKPTRPLKPKAAEAATTPGAPEDSDGDDSGSDVD
jgi:hypothetical protein